MMHIFSMYFSVFKIFYDKNKHNISMKKNFKNLLNILFHGNLMKIQSANGFYPLRWDYSVAMDISTLPRIIVVIEFVITFASETSSRFVWGQGTRIQFTKQEKKKKRRNSTRSRSNRLFLIPHIAKTTNFHVSVKKKKKNSYITFVELRFEVYMIFFLFIYLS